MRFPPEIEARRNAGEAFDLRGRPVEAGSTKATVVDQLYNSSDDPDEQHNLADGRAQAERLAAMRKLMRKHCAALPHAFGEFTE